MLPVSVTPVMTSLAQTASFRFSESPNSTAENENRHPKSSSDLCMHTCAHVHIPHKTTTKTKQAAKDCH